jgi:hypothetical protein
VVEGQLEQKVHKTLSQRIAGHGGVVPVIKAMPVTPAMWEAENRRI